MDIASLYSVSPDYLTQYGLNKYQQAPEEKKRRFWFYSGYGAEYD